MLKERDQRKDRRVTPGVKPAMPMPSPPHVTTGDDARGEASIDTPLLTSSTASSTSDSAAPTPRPLRGGSGSQSPPEFDIQRDLKGVVPEKIYTGHLQQLDGFFEIKRLLGRGLDSIVFEAKPEAAPIRQLGAEHMLELEAVAMKVMPKGKLHERNGRKLSRLKTELELWQQMRHPSVLQLLHVLETDDSVFVMCELASEELFDRMGAIGNLMESDCKLVVAQVASAVAHLHITHSVAHRDIKSANILCAHDQPTAPGCIKLADFGFTARFTDPRAAEFVDNCGTLECAPLLTILLAISRDAAQRHARRRSGRSRPWPGSHPRSAHPSLAPPLAPATDTLRRSFARTCSQGCGTTR